MHLVVHCALAFLLVISSVLTAFAGERPRDRAVSGSPTIATRVFVTHAGSDATGLTFVTALRDALRGSGRYALAKTEAEANILLVVASTSPEPRLPAASAVSLAYVANNEWRSLLGSSAKFVGHTRAASMGRATVDELTAVLAAYDPTVTP